MKYSSVFKHQDTCSLFNPEHKVSDKIADLFEELGDRDIVVKSTGCGSCFHSDQDKVVFFVAQDRGVQDSLHLKYGTSDDEEMSDKELACEILQAADEVGLDTDWNGSTARCVEVME
jgi:hypothetical protein